MSGITGYWSPEPGASPQPFLSRTRFNFHHHRLPVFVPHLSDVQQIMRIAVVPRPAIDKYPRATAAAVYHNAIVHVGVVGVGSLNICDSGQVPCSETHKCCHLNRASPALTEKAPYKSPHHDRHSLHGQMMSQKKTKQRLSTGSLSFRSVLTSP